jgi:hypothetical protein
MAALNGQQPFERLREVCVAELGSGASSETVYDALATLRPLLDETREDAVLDVMDQLVGWCRPDPRLDEGA